MSEQTATRDLQNLTNHGLLIPHGERRARYYTAGKEIADIRQRVIDRRSPHDESDPFDIDVVSAAAQTQLSRIAKDTVGLN